MTTRWSAEGVAGTVVAAVALLFLTFICAYAMGHDACSRAHRAASGPKVLRQIGLAVMPTIMIAEDATGEEVAALRAELDEFLTVPRVIIRRRELGAAEECKLLLGTLTSLMQGTPGGHAGVGLTAAPAPEQILMTASVNGYEFLRVVP